MDQPLDTVDRQVTFKLQLGGDGGDTKRVPA